MLRMARTALARLFEAHMSTMTMWLNDETQRALFASVEHDPFAFLPAVWAALLENVLEFRDCLNSLCLCSHYFTTSLTLRHVL